jgi:adenine-specific DNA-methyltransferase
MKQKLELTWVGKNENMAVEPRILIEDKSKSFSYDPEPSIFENDKFTDNILIHGDNLLALESLQQKYSKKVDFIYIDPPYNTGKAFDEYDDNLEHSIWLNLMYKRLNLLKKLLKDSGVICCHIDDSESHYLKVIMDEVFGRSNYLNSFYIQVRYPGKTLAEDSDYQKVIEQVLTYAVDRHNVSLNRPTEEYSTEKFIWKITELTSGEEVTLGRKKTIIFKPGEYKIEKIAPCLNGLKETWATGSLSRVKASAGEFFELYLSDRKGIDGLGVLYKVYGIGEDGLGYRYISGPKKIDANKGKFYSGIPLNRLEELKQGKSLKYLPVANFYDMAGNFGNCRLEGGVGFKGGKKPEILIKTLLDFYTKPGDLVLDSFLGSASTTAVAQKMGRKWIGIEMGEHAYTLCKPRMDLVISGKDKTGISKSVDYHAGGGYKFYELAPSLIKKDAFGQEVISSDYNAEMLASAIALHEGYQYCPDETVYWKQSKNQNNSFLFVTTRHVGNEIIESIKCDMKETDFLLIVCKSFDESVIASAKNISVKKIPQSLLKTCEFGIENYDLNIICPPDYEYGEEEDDNE